jgi:hyperosmotically inducible periplasmic protein
MRTATILTSVGLLFMAGCSQTGSTTSANTSGMTDSGLKQAVQARLNSNPELSAANLDIDADAKDNTVTLSGTVPTEDLRTQAVEMAKAASSGLQVTDRIDVKPREISRSEYTEQMAREDREKAKTTGDKIGTSIDDAWIHTKITAKLIGNSETPAHKINIDVVNGIVTLRGEVNTQTAKDEAYRVAKDTEGVRRVQNLLKVTAG